MSYNYIYLDDTPDGVEGTINSLQREKDIIIKFKRPGIWEEDIQTIVKLLPESNGVILDLRLNDIPNAHGKVAQYRGSTLAQELRTLAKEKNIKEVIKKDFPIVLISGDDKIRESLDESSLDLFDLVISKNKIEHPGGMDYHTFRNKLRWLADGYGYLNVSERTIEKVLGIDSTDILDSRFVDELQTKLVEPIHVIARFISKEIFERPSFLINEDYLACRLGVDQKSEDWEPLKEIISKDALYKGAFNSKVWPRWWMPLVDEFWSKVISQEIPLRPITSTQRVKLMSDKLGLTKLKAIQLSEKSKSETFWTVCKATRIPIDTTDGFIIAMQDDLFSWQEKEYITIQEALRPTNPDVWRDVATLEKNRLEKLKLYYGREESRIRESGNR